MVLPVTQRSRTPSFGESANLDAFERLRTSGQGGRADSVFTYDLQPLLFDSVVVGAGSVTHNANLRAVYLSTGGVVNGDLGELLLHYHAPYTPGNSQQIIITGNLNPDNDPDWTNARSEIGYGIPDNGVGFRYDEDGAHIFLRSSISGAPVETVIDQADWNVNKVPTVDWSKSQIFMIDFQSLAVGRIRFLLDRQGTAVLLHEIVNDNVRVGPFWQLASQQPYWRVENTGVANGAHRVLAICVTVKSEGAPDLENLLGLPFSASNHATPLTVSTTLLPVLSIRVLSTYKTYTNHTLIQPEGFDLMVTNPTHFEVLLNPTLTNPVWGAVHAESAVEVDTSATAIAGGVPLTQGFVSGSVNQRGSKGQPITGKIPMHVNHGTGVGDILTIAAIRVGTSNSDVSAALTWEELR